MLIKTKGELKTYISTLHKNASHDTLLSMVDQAEFKYVMPYVGPELMEELQAAYDGAGFSQEQAELMKLLGRAIAYYALLDSLPYLNASIGDTGVMENSPDGSSPARQWVYHQLETSTCINADLFLDRALDHLERNKASFEAWANSEAFRDSKSLYLNTTNDLTRLTNIQGSRRAFIALQPFIMRAEEMHIYPVLGHELNAELKASLLDPAARTEQQTELLRLVKRALAQFMIVESTPELSFQHTAMGLKVLSDNDGIRQRQGISMDERSNMATLARTRGEIFLEDLRRYLDKLLQAGETEPGDNDQAFRPFENTQQSQSFWI